MCPMLKKLTNKLQPYREVTRIIVEILCSKKGENIRILEHSISYAEYQFGKGVPGKLYREREDGERISNWIVEIQTLNGIITLLSGLYIQNKSLSSIDRDNMAFPYLERSLSILNPWVTNLDSGSGIVEIKILNEIITTLADFYRRNVSISDIDRTNMAFPYIERSLNILNPWVINLDPDSSNGIDSLSKDQIDRLLDELIFTEQNMAAVTGDRRQFDVAEGHCQRCLVYS
eukprot:CAMPEP_0119051096 /NCGR_PEP_ID=MMETSP1177-20130426/72829_1 /TAXON_ID=2985 /ORGANISM="Ochromonas sp, Strain CCMP1899" /LENGTH=230 /DNA_ID=CAMNT_0007030187 /DNA_START=129 /DNA_END=819 /DNA_ORIENTATION=+